MEHEKLQPIDLEVLEELYKKAYLPKTADEISKKLNIDYTNTLKIFTRLEKKAYAFSRSLIKKGNATKKTIILRLLT